MKAMIFAAGLGTRLHPLTSNKPKALVELNGKTLLERCINHLKDNGIKDIVINTHHFADQITNFISNKKFTDLNICISDERDELLDTGGGLLKAKNMLAGNEPILLINVDILTNLNLQKLKDDHLKNNPLATLVVRKRAGFRYLLVNKLNLLCGWKNEKTGEIKISRPDQIKNSLQYAFSGIHIIDPELLEMIDESGKFSIIDLYLRLAKTQSIRVFIDGQSTWMDVGKYELFEEAETLAKIMDYSSKTN